MDFQALGICDLEEPECLHTDLAHVVTPELTEAGYCHQVKEDGWAWMYLDCTWTDVQVEVDLQTEDASYEEVDASYFEHYYDASLHCSASKF